MKLGCRCKGHKGTGGVDYLATHNRLVVLMLNETVNNYDIFIHDIASLGL